MRSLFGLLVLGWFLLSLAPTQAAVNQRTSIAVLPFKQIGIQPQYAYLAEALPEALAAQLHKIPELNVLTRTHVQTLLKEQGFAESGLADTVNAPKIGNLTAAEYILTGSYQVQNEQILVTPQLIKTESGGIDFAEQIQSSVEEPLRVQLKLAEGITQKLALHLNPEVKKALQTQAIQNTNALKLYLDGLKALDKRQLQEAQSCFFKAIEIEPHFVEAHQGYQETHEKLGSYAQTLPYYQNWIKQHPDTVILWNYLGNVYQARKEWELAGQAYLKVLQAQPKFALVYNNLGVLALLSKNDQSEAAHRFNQAIESNPLEPLSYFNLGKLLFQQKKHFEGQSYFRKALQLSSGQYLKDIQDALFGGEFAIFGQGLTLPGGQEIGEVLIQRQSEQPVTVFRIYDALGGLSPIERAHTVAARLKTQLFELTPETIQVGEMNREVVLQTHSHDLIITIGAQAAERDNLSRSELAKQWGKTLAYMVAYQGMNYRTRGANAEPPEIKLLHEGDTLYSKGLFQQALAAYRKATQIRFNLYAAHYCQGMVLMELGKYSEAEASFENILKQKPDYIEGHVALADLYIKTAQYEWAHRFLNRALELNPNHLKANQLLKVLK
jgi:tetratricopeptide (TPR) repeat protein